MVGSGRSSSKMSSRLRDVSRGSKRALYCAVLGGAGWLSPIGEVDWLLIVQIDWMLPGGRLQTWETIDIGCVHCCDVCSSCTMPERGTDSMWLEGSLLTWVTMERSMSPGSTLSTWMTIEDGRVGS